MSDDINEEKFAEALRDLARDYNQPPMIVPRDAMYAAIIDGQQRRRASRLITFSRRFAPLAAAAVLVLGVGIALGRMSVRGPARPALTAAPSVVPSGVPDAYAIATTQQLVQAQALLTQFSANDRNATAGSKEDQHLASWARDLLSNTRLLLDSPAGADPHRKQLLEDLELVLIQIAALSNDAAASDRAAIAHTLDNAQVLPRIKAAIPTNQVGL